MKKRYWKALSAGLKSQYDKSQWVIGEWRKTECKELCVGFNCSPRVVDTMQYVNMEIVAQVETRGKSFVGDDKSTWEEMRIVKAWKWEKKDSVELAIYSAELVLGNYEKQYPNDDRPQKAIEAAKAWLTAKNKSAAESAARSAAWSAAWSAAESAALDKIEKWLRKRAKTLKPYEEARP